MFPRVIALLLSFLCIDVVMAVDTADAPLQLSQASSLLDAGGYSLDSGRDARG